MGLLNNTDSSSFLSRRRETCGIEAQSREDMLTVLTAVLQIGNMQFQEHETTEAASVTDEGHAKFVAQLLMVAEDSLISLFSTRVSSIRGETITKTLRLKESNANRDATAKRLFGELFSFIVARLNETLAPPSMTGDEVSIGLLDIFGFENFAKNSFEQLCINLANEQLQLYFNEHVFKLELEEFKKEGLGDMQIK